ncbi:hypothetical protein ACJIZ3_004245 [Penstemon smallii]|uniref:Ribosomal protein S11 n=1 Tax=Penstemon smallii TaxID=265156 RepID=A0ABD3S1H0_9LAMI
MILQRSPALRAGLLREASRVYGSGSGRIFQAYPRISQDCHGFTGLKDVKVDTRLESSILGNLGMKLGLLRVPENISLPSVMSFRSFIHSGKQAEFESGSTPRSMDYVKGLLQENGHALTNRRMDFVQGFQENRNGLPGRYPFHPSQLETNADIVHIKLMRNNAFVTITDSKGNKKKGVSAGKLAGKGGKLQRYSAEVAAENMGQEARRMKINSVVVKVSGFTFFRKKKDAIMAFKEGYSNSRREINPIVYIEDTTRKPHNGCRRKKQRRI